MTAIIAVYPQSIETVSRRDYVPRHAYGVAEELALPQELLGMDTAALLRLGHAGVALGNGTGLGSYETSRAVGKLPVALLAAPLVEKMLNKGLEPGDALRYRAPLLEIAGAKAKAADKLATAASKVGWKRPREVINQQLEQRFPVEVDKQLARARSVIERARGEIEPEIDFMASFENPQRNFVGELNYLANTVSSAIITQKEARINSPEPSRIEAEPPKGLLGFFTKAVRKVRSFFGFFKRQQPVQIEEVTAYDAAAGIQQMLSELAEDQLATAERLPMLSRLLLSRLPKVEVTQWQLAAVAPEILNFLFSTSTNNRQHQEILAGVQSHPHELRFVTNYKNHFSRKTAEGRRQHFYLDQIRDAALNLLPAVRDILPTDGRKVRQIFDRALDLLQPRHAAPEESANVRVQTQNDTTKPRRSLRDRFKRTAGKHRQHA